MQSDLVLHLDKVVAKLREEKVLLDQAITDLERLAQGRKRPRGRPAGRSSGLQRPGRLHAAAAAGGDIG
ncbi:hypothetical protein SBA3_820015 [Candidatus Sulfopaludibacter sp. SbA3]|nr:hypothetical protein SBA3_820015 [Candidatus Sulfopaludibacter sp. SbA3]